MKAKQLHWNHGFQQKGCTQHTHGEMPAVPASRRSTLERHRIEERAAAAAAAVGPVRSSSVVRKPLRGQRQGVSGCVEVVTCVETEMLASKMRSNFVNSADWPTTDERGGISSYRILAAVKNALAHGTIYFCKRYAGSKTSTCTAAGSGEERDSKERDTCISCGIPTQLGSSVKEASLSV